MKTTRLYTLLALLLIAAPLYAYDFSATCSSGQTLYYIITNQVSHEVRITYPCLGGNQDFYFGYKKPKGHVVIPDSVMFEGQSYAVTAIGPRSFSMCDSITEITFGARVTTIGVYAFYYCWGLETLSFPNSLTKIEEHAFHGCYNTRGKLVIPDSVVEIGMEAFFLCGFSELSLGRNVSKINGLAFNLVDFDYVYFNAVNCINNSNTMVFHKINKLEIGESVKRINGNMFFQANIYGIVVIPDSVTFIGVEAFYDNVNIDTVIIGNFVTSIGSYAFGDNSGLTHVELGASLTSIGEYAFGGTDIAGTLVIPDKVVSVASSAFGNGPRFTSLVVGESMRTIGWDAFGSPQLRNVYMRPAAPPVLSHDGFGYQNPHPAILHVPCESVEAYQSAANWSVFTSIETMPYDLEVESDDLGSGTVMVIKRGDCDNPESIVRATPKPGHEFAYWSVDEDIVSFDETFVFNLETNTRLVAHFGFEGIGEDFGDGFAAYPNPGKDVLNIRTALQNARIEVYDMNGRLIHSQAITENVTTINAEEWASETYIWKVMVDGKVAESGKWIKK